MYCPRAGDRSLFPSRPHWYGKCRSRPQPYTLAASSKKTLCCSLSLPVYHFRRRALPAKSISAPNHPPARDSGIHQRPVARVLKKLIISTANGRAQLVWVVGTPVRHCNQPRSPWSNRLPSSSSSLSLYWRTARCRPPRRGTGAWGPGAPSRICRFPRCALSAQSRPHPR